MGMQTPTTKVSGIAPTICRDQSIANTASQTAKLDQPAAYTDTVGLGRSWRIRCSHGETRVY